MLGVMRNSSIDSDKAVHKHTQTQVIGLVGRTICYRRNQQIPRSPSSTEANFSGVTVSYFQLQLQCPGERIQRLEAARVLCSDD